MADKLRAAVLGCGPAGLLAAHGLARAAADTGRELHLGIYSLKRPSPLHGCQYLHAPIPGLAVRSMPVEYKLQGSIDGYRRKVYGMEDVAASPGILETNHTAWDIRDAYDQLWNLYHRHIEEYFLSLGSYVLLRQQLAREGVDVVISTIPSPILCEKPQHHTFSYERVWAMGDAPGLGRYAEVPGHVADGVVLCSGRQEDAWYRISKVFGHHTVEWPAHHPAPKGASFVQKPIRTDCDCHDDDLVRSGRYATWTKGVLAHQSFVEGYALGKAFANV